MYQLFSCMFWILWYEDNRIKYHYLVRFDYIVSVNVLLLLFLFFLQFFMFNGFAVLLPISMRRPQSNQVWQKPCVLSRFAAKPLFALCIDADCAYKPFFEDRIHMWIACKIHSMCVFHLVGYVGNLSPLRNYYHYPFLGPFFMGIENGLLRNIIFKWLGRQLCSHELNLRFRDVRSHPTWLSCSW